MTINVMKEYLKIVQEELTTYMKLIFEKKYNRKITLRYLDAYMNVRFYNFYIKDENLTFRKNYLNAIKEEEQKILADMPKNKKLIEDMGLFFYYILYFDKINFIELFILSNVETILIFLNLYFITKLNSNNLISLILFMMIVITVQFFVGILKDKKLISMNLHISKKLMSETYQSILLLPYQYYRNHTTGDLMTRINDLEEIKDFVPIYIIKINQVCMKKSLNQISQKRERRQS